MSGTFADLMAVTEPELGNTRGAKYFNYFGEVDLGPWCVAFDRWGYAVAGIDFPWSYWFAWDWGDVPKDLAVDKGDMYPGLPISFDWDGDWTGDHVGFIRGVYDWGLATREGNTGSPGAVRDRQRLWSEVICGIKVKLADSKPTPATIAVDGICGHETIKAWQRAMGTTVDGVLSDQLWPHDQYRVAVTAIEHYILDYQDWGYQGSSLVKAVQRRVGVTADGDWGYNTTCAIQRKLRAWGYYHGDIDGDFGPHSVESLQRSINDKKW